MGFGVDVFQLKSQQCFVFFYIVFCALKLIKSFSILKKNCVLFRGV